MLAILAPAVLFPGEPNGRIRRILTSGYKPIPAWLDSCLTIPPVARRPLSTTSCIHGSRDLQLNMRLIARFVFLMVAVFGVSLAFAWAWDKSDKPQDKAAAHAAT
jgi:hypothetical protein